MPVHGGHWSEILLSNYKGKVLFKLGNCAVKHNLQLQRSFYLLTLVKMADSLVLVQLKADRTSAKRQLLRLVNNVLRMHTVMSEEELKDSFKSLTMEANKVFEAIDDVEDQYTVESELEGGALTDQQRADLEKASSECENKLMELKELIVQTLWVKYGEEELSLAVEAAELEVERVEAIAPSEDKEIFDFMIAHLGELVKRAKDLHTQWKSWAPPEEQQQLQTRIRKLDRGLMKLTSRKAEFIKVGGKEDNPNFTTTGYTTTPATQSKPASLPKFPGTRGDFHCWRKDWEALQKHGDPTGSKEIKTVQLLDSIDDTTSRNLHLSTYTSADDIFRVLENCYGNKTNNAIAIVEDLQRLSPVKGDQPRKIIELIQLVEKAYIDLSYLGESGAIKNTLMTKSLESKLPDSMKKDWLLYAAEKDPEQSKRFDTLLVFLKIQETIYEQLDKLQDEHCPKVKQDPQQSKAAMQTNSSAPECIICGHAKHGQRLYFCRKFQALKLREKKDAVRRLGACKKCLEIHFENDFCKKEFLCQRPECSEEQHHFYLCPRIERPRTFTGLKTRVSAGGRDNLRSYTKAQQEFVKKLPPELAKECRHVFRNSATRTSQATSSHNLSERRFRGWPNQKKFYHV